jgi:hypothetical protein
MRSVWNRYNNKDIEFAGSIKKPLYIGEVGFKSGMNRARAKILELDIAEKFSRGVSGYILWSFEAQGWNRDGHNYGFGIDDGCGEIVREWNEKLNR